MEIRQSPTRGDTDGTVHRTGRPRGELHARGHFRSGQAAEGLPGRDERRGAGRGDSDDPRSQAPGLRREQPQAASTAECLALRDAYGLAEQKKQAERDLLREARKQPIVRILETAAGFGLIRSARLVPIVTRSLSAAPTASLSHEAAVLELLRPRPRHALELGLGPDARGGLDPGSCSADPGTLSAIQPGADARIEESAANGESGGVMTVPGGDRPGCPIGPAAAFPSPGPALLL